MPRFSRAVSALPQASHFLVDPRGEPVVGRPGQPTPTARLLLRSMGYRDALIGGLLAVAALRGKNTRGWFLASGGADAADLLGGLSVHGELPPLATLIGLGGAVVGIGVGLWGDAPHVPRRQTPSREPMHGTARIRDWDRHSGDGSDMGLVS